jgi:integrase
MRHYLGCQSLLYSSPKMVIFEDTDCIGRELIFSLTSIYGQEIRGGKLSSLPAGIPLAPLRETYAAHPLSAAKGRCAFAAAFKCLDHMMPLGFSVSVHATKRFSLIRTSEPSFPCPSGNRLVLRFSRRPRRDFLATKVSVNSTNNRLKILRVALQQAWRDGKMEENPGKKVQSLKKPRGGSQRRAFSLEELKALLKEASGEWKGQLLFGIYTGQRLGDIAQLRWEDIDVEKKILSLSTQKTERRQILPLAPAVVRWLAGAAKEISGKPEGLVFPAARAAISKNGKVGTLSNQFYTLMSKAGLVAPRLNHNKKPDGGGRTAVRVQSSLSFHSLRHTTTSMMKNSGVSPAFVQEFVGHDSKTVSQNYTHIELASLQEAVDTMPDLL